MPLNPQNVIANLQELRALTSNEDGAQRIAFTPTWTRARTASRTVFRLTPRARTSSGSGGTRKPTGHSPEVISSSRRAITVAASVDLGISASGTRPPTIQ